VLEPREGPINLFDLGSLLVYGGFGGLALADLGAASPTLRKRKGVRTLFRINDLLNVRKRVLTPFLFGSRPE
jgi:hypothetical protein